MAKGLNQSQQQMQVSLRFTADTEKAKQQIKDLQLTLSNLASKGANRNDFGLNKEINEAVVSANKLQIALENATNVDTGKLDLSKFMKSMNPQQLAAYGKQLQALGPEGEKAFKKIVNAVNQAEEPLKRQSALLTSFRNTFMNTIRWQFSSSLLHGFMGAIHLLIVIHRI